MLFWPLEILPAGPLFGPGYIDTDRWVPICATCSPVHLLCMLWTPSSSSGITSFAMAWLHGRLRYVPLTWTALHIPAQHGQSKSGCGARELDLLWLLVIFFSPVSWWTVLAFAFFRILHPSARCPDSPFYLGCKFSLLFQKVLSDYFYLEIS